MQCLNKVVCFAVFSICARSLKGKDVLMQLLKLKSLIDGIRVQIFPRSNIALLKVVPKFLANAKEFSRLGGKIDVFTPRLDEFEAPAGVMSGAYFHHDLLIARQIFERNPKRHLDVGSRIDGFVAHVASFREIEIIDIRKFESNVHQQIKSIQFDFSGISKTPPVTADSVSCLNTLEHFGLGRYNDPIDLSGHIKGFNNLISILEPGGILYVAIPVSNVATVFFNVHRTFLVDEILSWSEDRNVLKLIRYDYVDAKGELHLDIEISDTPDEYGIGECVGIYTFLKSN